MPKSTLSAGRSKGSKPKQKPEKPYPYFPLFAHATGRGARKQRDGLTVAELCSAFLTSKQRLLDAPIGLGMAVSSENNLVIGLLRFCVSLYPNLLSV